jgi:glycosyltransferase involved in cell wall biosynthesis
MGQVGCIRFWDVKTPALLVRHRGEISICWFFTSDATDTQIYVKLIMNTRRPIESVGDTAITLQAPNIKGLDLVSTPDTRRPKNLLEVVSIAHSAFGDGSARLRYHPFAHDPHVKLTLVAPDRWKTSEKYFVRGTDPVPIALRTMKVVLPALPKVNWYLHFYPGLSRLLDELTPDVLHLWEEPWSIVAAQAAYLCGRRGIALVLETEQNIHRVLPFPFEAIRRLTLARTDMLIARQKEALAVSRECGYQGPVTFVEYTLDTRCFRPDSGNRPAKDLSVDLTIGYVGRFIREKGLFTVLDALKACRRNINFLLMGEGKALAELRDRIRELGLDEKVKILAPQTQVAQVARFMNSLDALVLMSETTRTWKEQFGRVIIEAQACGVPVIGSSSGAIPSVVGRGGWIIEEGNSLQLSALIDDLAQDADKLKAASREALINAERFFPEIVSKGLREAWFGAMSQRQRVTQDVSLAR